MSIISLLVALVLIGLLFWAVRVVSAALQIPQPIVMVIHVFMVVIVVLWLLQTFGLMSGGPILKLQP